MLVQKLRVDDLQSERGFFDGVMVYAQNKVAIQAIKQHRGSPPLSVECNVPNNLLSLI